MVFSKKVWLNWGFALFQEREYKEALEAFNEKNKEKVQLITKLMEVGFDLMIMIPGLVLFLLVFVSNSVNVYEQLVSESEKLRMKKLEELSKNIDSLQH